MTGYTNTDAPGQMRGFFLQIERALFWLSTLPPGSIVGIETGDDVVIKNVDGNTTQEQDKSSISNKQPLSDSSKDLWKTLCIWLKALDADDGEKITNLLLVSNRKIPTTRFVWQINKARTEEELKLCLEKLKTFSSKSTEIKAYIDEVLTYSDEKLVSLLQKISVFDNASIGIDGVEIRDNLKIAKDIPFDKILLTLKGWIFDEAIKYWDAREPAWISVDALISLTTTLVTDYNKRPFIEKAVAHLPISAKDLNEKRNETFVQQLDLVSAQEEDKIDAIRLKTRGSSAPRVNHNNASGVGCTANSVRGKAVMGMRVEHSGPAERRAEHLAHQGNPGRPAGQQDRPYLVGAEPG